MEVPVMFQSTKVNADIETLVSYFPIPLLGVIPVNSFVIRAKQPVLIDTGLAAVRSEFMHRLREAIDPAELRWIWLTHTDADHVGNLQAVLDEAPKARIVTTFLGMGKLGLLGLPVDRCYLLNPGQSLDVGDRMLTAIKPPSFDAPETTGLLDSRTRALFSSDAFGALMREPAVEASDIPHDELGEGVRQWAAIDAPWLAKTDATLFGRSLQEVRAFDSSVLLSSHLPTARGLTEALLGHLSAVRTAPTVDMPDQATLERMIAEAAVA